MRSSTLFFILGLLVIANAQEEVNVFAQLDEHPFGSTLLNLVQINMQSNAQSEMKTEDSINQISELLNDLSVDMRSNKKSADNDHKNFQDKASFDIASYEKVLAEQKARKTQTENQLNADRKLKQSTEADLASAQTHLSSVKAQIKSADEANVKAIAAFEKKEKELKEAISACKDANKELAKLNVGSFAQINMVQIKGGMQKVEHALTLHLPARLTIYKPIITALVDMGTNADPKLVAKVVSLINDLRNALEGELSNAQKSEKRRIQDYDQLRADLVNDQRNTETRIGRNLTLIASLTENIKQNQGILDELNKTIPANEALLATRKAQKKAEQESYEKDDANRVSEIKVIDQLIAYFNEKFSKGLSTYLRNRVSKL